MYTGKYIRLAEFLSNISETERFTLTFEEIERILQFKLPSSAYKHSAWWANERVGTHTHARSWLSANWKTSEVELGNRITFVRMISADHHS